MADKPLSRPRQVSFSGWTIVVGSVLTILFAFQRVSELGSLESQQAALDFVSTSPGDGLGLKVSDVQTAIRVMCLIAGGTAAATAVLGWYAMQPTRSARLILSVLAPVLFVAGLTSGGLFPALIAVSVAMLWVQPARDYFNGRAPMRQEATTPAVPVGAGSTGTPPVPPVPTVPPGPTGQPVPPPSGSSWDLPHPEQAPSPGETMTGVSQQPANPYGNPYGAPAPTPGTVGAGPTQRPGRVTAAVVTTIVASGVTFAALGVFLLYLLSNRSAFLDQIDQQMAGNAAYDDISPDSLANLSIGFLVVLAIWCLGAILLAVGVLRGSNGARITLVVSAALSALVSLLGALVVVPLVLTIASIVTIVLLVTGSTNAWFASRKNSH